MTDFPQKSGQHPATAQIDLNKNLSAFNTLALPVEAEQFARFNSIAELLTLLDYADQQRRLGHNKSTADKFFPLRILGGGSNVLMPQRLDGLVLQSAMESIAVLRENETHIWLKVDAGVNWHTWVLESIEFGHGLENLALIPGTVGAAPIQNIGAYGVEVGELIESVQGVCLSARQLMTLSPEQCRFGYRDSVFKRELNNDFIVTSVIFRLNKTFAPNISYGPLSSWAESNPDFSAADLIAQVCAIRSSKLPDPANIPNAGSFFKNPIIDAALAQKLAQQYPNMPQYPQGNGQEGDSVKVAAGWLIEQAGWKGKALGNTTMHAQQALVLTTNGQADLTDVYALRDAVKADVLKQFGIELEPEPQLF